MPPKSYKRLYQSLPAGFIESMAEQYGPRELDAILDGFMCKRPATLRVNALKADVREVMEAFRKQGVKHERAQWYADALIIRNKRERDLEQNELYTDGRVYLQSLSSMIPPLVMQPKPGWRVLDLTAAPGSKTTQIAALMGNEGYILANELNQIRGERLKFNIARQGAFIAEVRIGDGKRLEPDLAASFDAVLLDAPCSGVGLFSADSPVTFRAWSPRNVGSLVKEQRSLLRTAAWALRPGGILIYSTCTLTSEENEQNVAWALSKLGEVAVLMQEPVDLEITGAGVSTIRRDGCLLVLPSELYEGFFVAKMRKRA
ncbi:MAG: RsmB/NOP family class I SAM-dependent RNA methyltransferase [Clostridia bacterium]|nr:RsmB/NOP family class I SAM-dependent RNA methyltransferase [Clostridia bacterium]